jgi:hypothetical protein
MRVHPFPRIADILLPVPPRFVTPALIGKLIVPHLNVILEDLPRIAEIPSARKARKLGQSFAGLPLVLETPPTIAEIARYARAARDGVPEIGLAVFGDTHTLVIGTDSHEMGTHPAWNIVEDYASNNLHTHPIVPSDSEDAAINHLPSLEDLEVQLRQVHPTGHYVAHQDGITRYKLDRSSIKPGVDWAFADYYDATKPQRTADKASGQELCDIYGSFLSQAAELRTARWEELPDSATVQTMGPFLSPN